MFRQGTNTLFARDHHIKVILRGKDVFIRANLDQRRHWRRVRVL
jgi:hypothetical protein